LTHLSAAPRLYISLIRGPCADNTEHGNCAALFARCRACHNLLRAHAAAVKTYRTWYQPKQGGKIGLTTNVVWAEPLTNSFEGEPAAVQTRHWQPSTTVLRAYAVSKLIVILFFALKGEFT
jgi:beta-glucosidase/6-phospho-beta-glucosidase/beta-galactosidase